MYLCAFLFFIHLTRLKGGARLTFKRFKFDLSVFIKTLRFGIPAVITGAAYAITNILIQPHINYYGDMGISACTAASAIEGYLSSITGAVALTMITFLSQNIAAGKRERVRRLLSRGYLIAILLTLLYSLVVILFDEQLLSLFIPGENDAIRFASVRFIYVLGIGGVINGIMSINVAALQSYGYTTIHTVSNFFAICVFRIFWTKVLYPLNHKPEMLWACYPASWIITAAALFTITVMLTKKLTQGKEFKL